MDVYDFKVPNTLLKTPKQYSTMKPLSQELDQGNKIFILSMKR